MKKLNLSEENECKLMELAARLMPPLPEVLPNPVGPRHQLSDRLDLLDKVYTHLRHTVLAAINAPAPRPTIPTPSD